MKALSIRQPWAWLIVNGWKNIENRPRLTHLRGPILIHASKTMTMDDYLACVLFLQGFTWGPALIHEMPERAAFQRGGIIGQATILDCVEQHDSDWFCGEYGYVLADAHPLPFLPCKGSLNFFNATHPNCPF
jgi:hypothetical protein